MFNRWNISTHVLALLGGILLCYSFLFVKHKYFKVPTQADSPSIVRLPAPNKFISPLLLSGDNKNNFLKNELYNSINEYIREEIVDGNAKNISFYYRDLNTGYWTGVNESDAYAPASLMKIPILIAILKQTETDTKLLQQKIYFEGKSDKNNEEEYKSEHTLIGRKYYTVDELLKYMIVYSDNNAALLLLEVVSKEKLLKIFTDLGLPIPENSNSPGAVDYISASIYSRLFRVLYNVTYLDEKNSTKALEFLSQTEFADGIRIPELANESISHKFGERTVHDENKNILYRELHDCGIVYYPGHPYLLCVMTKGDEFEKLEKIIQNISKLTSESVKSNQ